MQTVEIIGVNLCRAISKGNTQTKKRSLDILCNLAFEWNFRQLLNMTKFAQAQQWGIAHLQSSVGFDDISAEMMYLNKLTTIGARADDDKTTVWFNREKIETREKRSSTKWKDQGFPRFSDLSTLQKVISDESNSQAWGDIIERLRKVVENGVSLSQTGHRTRGMAPCVCHHSITGKIGSEEGAFSLRFLALNGKNSKQSVEGKFFTATHNASGCE